MSELRASDAERDQAVEILSSAVAEGRLTLEEYSERSGSALSARTQGELAALTSDIPVTAGTALAGQVARCTRSSSRTGWRSG